MIKQVVNVNNTSIGPIGLMWVLLVALKLMHVVDWAWWIIVFFPVLASLGFMTFAGVLLLLTGALVWTFSD